MSSREEIVNTFYISGNVAAFLYVKWYVTSAFAVTHFFPGENFQYRHAAISVLKTYDKSDRLTQNSEDIAI